MDTVPPARTRLLAQITLVKLLFGVPALLGGGLAATPVRAQAPASTPELVTLDLRNVPARAALRTLFAASGNTSYVIDPDVRGLASAQVTALPFQEALRQVVASVSPALQYTEEGGTYRVSVKRAAPPPLPPMNLPTSEMGLPGSQVVPGAGAAATPAKRFYRIPINSYDASYIASLLTAQGITDVGINQVIAAGGTGQTGGGQIGGPSGGMRGGGRSPF